MKTVRTRIAPSPTGEDLHIGNAYTALINYVFAKKHNGQFLIRIEDTDRSRFVEGSEQRILASLSWLGIRHDEGPDIGGPYAPYRQSDRLPIYKKYAEELIAKGHAFYCFCTQERLAQMRQEQEAKHQPPMYDGHCKTLTAEEARKKIAQGEAYVIRLNVPEEGTTVFTDLIRGEISFENKLIDDQVLLKSDGFPTYHLGVVVDDHVMGVSHIIRGEEWISSTPKHILLYAFFGWELPQFAHMPVLRNPDKSKLSKRKNPVWVSMYKNQGFLPEAITNYLTLLAWAHPKGKEIYSVEEMITVFELTQIQTTAPIFDVEKLRWMNGEYIRKAQPSSLISYLSDFYQGKYPAEGIRKVLPLVVERMKTLAEFATLADFFFAAPKGLEQQPGSKENIQILIRVLTAADTWTHPALEGAIREAAEKYGKKAKDMFMDLRISVTGKTVGPPLLESLEILGKTETLARLNNVK